MACIQLSLNLQPPVVGYLNLAYPLSILSVRPVYLPWLSSHYVQLVCPQSGNGQGLNFYRHPAQPVALCPLLDVEWLNRDIAARTAGGVSRFVRDRINADYYVQLHVDEFHIPRRQAHRKAHYVHEILVFGYDDAARSFDIVGYDERGVYAASRVGYADLEHAFDAVSGEAADAGTASFPAKLWLARYLEEARYDFDRQVVVEQLQDYLFGRNTSERMRLLDNPAGGDAYLGVRRKVPKVYGMDIYPRLHQYMQSLTESGRPPSPIPWRILWEHKKCMLLRVRYMEERGHLQPARNLGSECAELADSAQTLRLMMLKFTVRPSGRLLARARARLHAIAESEADLLRRLLGALEEG